MYGKPVTSSWRTANYAYPRGAGKDRGKRPSYPIDPRHVRAALARSSQRGTASSRRAIEGALRKRYGSVSNALAAARRSSAHRSARSTTARRSTTTRASSARRRSRLCLPVPLPDARIRAARPPGQTTADAKTTRTRTDGQTARRAARCRPDGPQLGHASSPATATDAEPAARPQPKCTTSRDTSKPTSC
jgi:hypothetical protein